MISTIHEIRKQIIMNDTRMMKKSFLEYNVANRKCQCVRLVISPAFLIYSIFLLSTVFRFSHWSIHVWPYIAVIASNFLSFAETCV